MLTSARTPFFTGTSGRFDRYPCTTSAMAFPSAALPLYRIAEPFTGEGPSAAMSWTGIEVSNPPSVRVVYTRGAIPAELRSYTPTLITAGDGGVCSWVRPTSPRGWPSRRRVKSSSASGSTIRTIDRY